MRTRGWGGNRPASDDEAIERILDAARRCIDAKGATTTISDVAVSLEVTRATVYRYFASTDELLQATGTAAAAQFMNRLAAHVAGTDDPGDAIVEMVAYLLESLPTEPYIGVLFTSDRIGTFARGVTSESSMAIGHALLQRLGVDLASVGLTGEVLDQFVEHVLRLIQSLVLDPGRPPRSGAELRGYLRLWLWGPVASLTPMKAAGRRGSMTATTTRRSA